MGDYSSEIFLAALRRFAARRGTPAVIYSDQGTTFVGADRELRAQLRRAVDADSTIAEADGIEWRFNPTAAPHFGGLWEAGVRSVKHHLHRVLRTHTLTYKEYATLLTRIEAALNSRPLCPLSEDPDDMEALTPGHFLMGRPLLAPPEPGLEGVPEGRLGCWQLLYVGAPVGRENTCTSCRPDRSGQSRSALPIRGSWSSSWMAGCLRPHGVWPASRSSSRDPTTTCAWLA